MDARPRLEVLPRERPQPLRRLCVIAGVDGSPLSDRVLRWCASLAAVADLEVVAVYALEERSYPPHFHHRLPRAADRTHAGWRDEIRARIDLEWCAPLHLPGVRRRIVVGDGRPWEVLARAARRHDADLAVVGCRPRGTLVEALRPGVSRRLPRRSPCPVVVVPEAPAGLEDTGPVAPPLERILVGSDGGAAAAAALGWAAGLAADLDAEMVVARVIAAGDAPPQPAAGTARRPRVVDDVTATLEQEFAALGSGVRPRRRTAVLVGDAPAMLLALAESETAGLVVLGVEEGRRPSWLRAGAVVSRLTRSAPCPVALVASGAASTENGSSRRTDDMSTETQRPRGVRFAAGTVVSPGEYRNCDTGTVRYFDGHTPLPGGVNSASWQQVSDHHHPSAAARPSRGTMPETAAHPVRFAAGAMVSPGEYRNCDTGAVRYFDGTTPLPGSANSASWQQVSDHQHPSSAGHQPEQRHSMPDTASRPVRFPAGTMVSPGEYRNCETGAVRYFDGSTPLPGGSNASSWQQVSDHHHPGAPARS
ncbi:MAG TPA: universal stress protein [Candidatus Dormibacteraeota bacterium]|jgi:nucleotide-binding universal stress UspA family protein